MHKPGRLLSNLSSPRVALILLAAAMAACSQRPADPHRDAADTSDFNGEIRLDASARSPNQNPVSAR